MLALRAGPLMSPKYVKILAALLFIVSLVFVFFGLESETRPNTIPLMTVAMICLAASISVLVIGLCLNTRQRMILICGVGLVLFAILAPPCPRVVYSPYIRQIKAMSEIGMKLRQYDLDHPALETDDLGTKSIDDLVTMNVLTAADAAYLREHDVTFHGYDPNRIGPDVPLLEAIYIRGKTKKRIVCYSDAHVGTSPVESAK